FTPAETKNDWNEVVFDVTSPDGDFHSARIRVFHNDLWVLSGGVQWQVQAEWGAWSRVHMNPYNTLLYPQSSLNFGFIDISNGRIEFYCRKIDGPAQNLKMRFRRHSIE
ncbi:MAG: hypothetical protein ACOCRU_03085, partial [bacterium]